MDPTELPPRMTYLCVPITATDPAGALSDAKAAVAAGADAIELRLDYLAPLRVEDVGPLVREVSALGQMVIATCRVPQEGGRYEGDEPERIQVYLEAIRAGVDCIDIELDSWSRSSPLRERIWKALDESTGSARRVFDDGCAQILSQHDFEKSPECFGAVLGAMLGTPVDIVKVAVKANSIVDSVRVLEALRQWKNVMPAIALSMGETGVVTRVLAKKFGGFLTFASLADGKESAPGQISVAQMKSLYRWDAIGEQTLVYGVVGCPVAHSMSPAIHNAAFNTTGHDGIYLPIRVEPEYRDFKKFLDAFLERPWSDLRGLSVTIPHKENLLRYVRDHIARFGEGGGTIEPLADRIGVANTLVIEPVTDGRPVPAGVPAFRLHVSNTDYAGALDALCLGMGVERKDLKGMRVAVLGAGGASRAIVAGLRDCDAIVQIYNRTGSKARALASEFGTIAMPWETREVMDVEVIINCTSIGMWPEVNETPLESACIPPNSVVFDTVYNPIETRLLRDARKRHCQTIDGVSMFVNQAALQFKRWTGIDPPLDVMRSVVVKRLSQ